MKKVYLTSFLSIILINIYAQENYEIQVYGSSTTYSGTSILELHSNYTLDGIKNTNDGVIPSQHSLHETLEFTHGITKNFEIGFYLFTNYTPGYGYQFVGSHIRPRIKAPDVWKLPIGLSLSAEIGAQRSKFASDVWSLELRPIIDKQWKRIYLSVNPVLGFSLKGSSNSSFPAFSPNVKLSYQLDSLISGGVEYYGELGTIAKFSNFNKQVHALFLTFDLYINPLWEFNFGPGIGITPSTDKFVFKSYIGRRINWKRKK